MVEHRETLEQSLHLWGYSDPSWRQPWAPCCSWPCSRGGVGRGMEVPARLRDPAALWDSQVIVVWNSGEGVSYAELKTTVPFYIRVWIRSFLLDLSQIFLSTTMSVTLQCELFSVKLVNLTKVRLFPPYWSMLSSKWCRFCSAEIFLYLIFLPM